MRLGSAKTLIGHLSLKNDIGPNNRSWFNILQQAVASSISDKIELTRRKNTKSSSIPPFGQLLKNFQEMVISSRTVSRASLLYAS